jgi:hypothetical protein
MNNYHLLGLRVSIGVINFADLIKQTILLKDDF